MFSIDNTEPIQPSDLPTAQQITPDGAGNTGAQGKTREDAIERHSVLMQCLRDEADLQAEERLQMSIDHDYQDHLHWRREDAEVLMSRGQAPLVFNEGAQSVNWMLGMQKRLRTDGTVLPREPGDDKAAEAKSKVFKYVSDANLAPWHVSRAFEEAVISGLGWLEEGVETDPSRPLIYSGSETWRNVYRDSRSEHFDLNVDSRYLIRRKRVDLDYAIAMMPWARAHLAQHADKDGDERADDPWYLGERLTGSTDLTGTSSIPMRYRDRSAYIGGHQGRDYGRRLALDLHEWYYVVPEAAQVFAAGPLRGKEFDPNNDGHQQLKTDRWAMYRAVMRRMRVMVGTESAPMWDGKSPYRHGMFPLIPVWGIRRGRDGMCYGLWRGMRDLNDDMNKRASKALHAASSNRVKYKKGAIKDVERARQEAARPDMMLEVEGDPNNVQFEKPAADLQANMELLTFDQQMIRNSGGVTDANLGRDSRVISGVAVKAVQDQGSLTTSKFPDNLRLAMQIAGRQRLANIEQFMTQRQVIRITGESSPIEWLTINDPQPDGSVLNPMYASQADFIIAERDYRESFAQAAMEAMMELLGKIGTFAPQVVLSVLDLLVESNPDIRNRDEWVARIRKINGQRDPKKAPTPEELAQQQRDQADAERQKQIQMDTLQAGLDKLRAEVGKLDTDALLKRVESMFSALQAAQIVAVTPGVAPVADTIAAGAGFKDQQGQDPNLPQPATPIQPAAPVNVDSAPPTLADGGSPTGLEGMQQGIETPTGADNGPAM